MNTDKPNYTFRDAQVRHRPDTRSSRTRLGVTTQLVHEAVYDRAVGTGPAGPAAAGAIFGQPTCAKCAKTTRSNAPFSSVTAATESLGFSNDGFKKA